MSVEVAGKNFAPLPLLLSQEQKIAKEEEKVDFVDSLPQEISLEIFSYLNSKELTRCFRVNTAWKVLASDETLWNALYPKIAFGKKQWETYFGDIGKEPPLPKEIHKILGSPCPFNPGKTVNETHMLVLIPAQVNGKPLNLNTLRELVKNPKEGHKTIYDYIYVIFKEYSDKSPPSPHWVLITKDVIPGSRAKAYAEQKTIVEEKPLYEVPDLLSAAVALLTNYVHTGITLFSRDPWTYTRCKEKLMNCQYHTVVGGFAPSGLVVDYNDYDVDSVGVAALRKFF